jgi:hypothetical protein
MPGYSELLPSDLAQIRDLTLRAQHGDDTVDELEELDRGIALADRALRMAREELAIEAGVDLAKFEASAAPFEKTVGPWLKKTPDGVRVLRWNAAMTSGTLAVPTADCNGVCFTPTSKSNRAPMVSLRKAKEERATSTD